MKETDLQLERIVAHERIMLEEKERHEYLAGRRSELEGELRVLQEEIAEVVAKLHAVGRQRVEFGDLRRLTPISPVWGLDRGIPLDRYYILSFLDRCRADVRGRVLEVKDSGYTRAFGDDRVIVSDVLDIDSTNPRATVVVDLSCADAIADDTYDCFILTQTLGVIFDVASALRHAIRVLKPGGVLLCTLPAVGRISYEEGLDGDFWRFTEASVKRLFTAHCSPDTFEVAGHGNVLASAAFLYGLAPDELTKEELDTVDPYFPVVYTVRAVKPHPSSRRRLVGRDQEDASQQESRISGSGIVLAYHRVADVAIDRHGLCVSVRDFASQMQHLQSDGYRVVPLRELLDAADSGALDGRSVALTFDDGYRDAVTEIAPILADCRFPATFFLVGDALDGSYEFWWDTLERVFFSGHRLPDGVHIRWSGGEFEGPTSTIEQRVQAHRRLVEEFYRLNHASRVEALGALAAWGQIRQRPPGAARPMTTDDARWLAALPGLTIGAHSQHHVSLLALSSEDAAAEIRESKATLESLIGCRVDSFSYPYGMHDAAAENLVRSEGFTIAVTTVAGPVTRGVNRFRVPRWGVGRLGFSAFATRLRTVLS